MNVAVALGDSITEGFDSTIDANHRWPDYLSARVNAHGVSRLAVVNQGIGCSRLLWDFCGPNGSARFDRDVLAVTGATHVIVALGLNDIGLPVVANIPSQVVSADAVIAGLKQLVERAHAEGLTIVGATITPVGSSIFPGFFTPENEAKRQAVNQWIRTSHTFDGVVDFDRAVRDPADPRSSGRPTTAATASTRTTPATRRWRTPSICPCCSSELGGAIPRPRLPVRAGSESRALRARETASSAAPPPPTIDKRGRIRQLRPTPLAPTLESGSDRKLQKRGTLAESSFDVVSSVDLQEVKNAIAQAMKEIITRFDLKGTSSDITLTGEEITLDLLGRVQDQGPA